MEQYLGFELNYINKLLSVRLIYIFLK